LVEGQVLAYQVEELCIVYRAQVGGFAGKMLRVGCAAYGTVDARRAKARVNTDGVTSCKR